MNKEQLLEIAYRLGIRDLVMEDSNAKISAAINEVLGKPIIEEDEIPESIAHSILSSGPDAVAKAGAQPNTNTKNIPNLTPTGIWHGKRCRLRRPKTGTNDMAGAIFNWNGFICIIPIDVEVDVAWPIFEAIKLCNGMKMKIRQEEDPRNPARVNNVKEIDYYRKYPYEVIGITPGTEDLPESPWEYVLDQYVDNFPGFTVRMWRQLCVQWEISDNEAGVMPGMKPKQEVEARRNAVHFNRNLPVTTDLQMRMRVRNEKRADIHMRPKAA